MSRSGLLASAFAAAAGAGIALGVAAALGAFDKAGVTTIIREVVASGESQSIAARRPSGLTIGAIYDRSAPGVVQVASTSAANASGDPLFGGAQAQRALGSGFVIDKAGHIVTNYHVVEGAKTVQVSFSDNDSVKARVVGVDPSTDLAVLLVDTRSRALTPLPLGDSSRVKVGDEVVAIGNPFGLDRTITSGIVSALQRGIQAPNGFTIDHVIQTDAALNHGNSGGPLLDVNAQVIGVNSQIETGGSGDGNVGVGFAVPINTVRDVAAQLIRAGHVEHAFLGVKVHTLNADVEHTFRLPSSSGLLVEQVVPGSAAAHAGLRAGKNKVVIAGESYVLGGDVILRVDGKAVTSGDALREISARLAPGDRLELTVLRGNDRREVTVKLGRQPTSPQA